MNNLIVLTVVSSINKESLQGIKTELIGIPMIGMP